MNLKNAALLALAGTLVLSILVAADFVNTVLGVVRDVIPAVGLLRSIIYLVTSATVTVFFYVFHKGASSIGVNSVATVRCVSSRLWAKAGYLAGRVAPSIHDRKRALEMEIGGESIRYGRPLIHLTACGLE
jgi:hypothetical protein